MSVCVLRFHFLNEKGYTLAFYLTLFNIYLCPLKFIEAVEEDNFSFQRLEALSNLIDIYYNSN